MRILSKGSKLPFVHESVGWNKSTNFKDYDIVYVNLKELENTSQDYDHPYNQSEKSPKLLDKVDVTKFIKTGGYMVVYLPDTDTIEMDKTTTQPKNTNSATPLPRAGQTQGEKKADPYKEYDIFDWLPFSVTLDTKESGKSVEVHDDGWEWYFGNYFKWDKIIKHSARESSYNLESIAENSYSEPIATKATDRYSGSDGYVVLIPPDSNVTYSDFVRQSLQNVFNIESNVSGRSPPSWVANYSLPDEDKTKKKMKEKENEIEELESELNSVVKFKDLLYETNIKLEETVRDALRDLGFDVENEIPGKRDGVLRTSDAKFVLEITGTTGGIKLSKCRQLDDWVENMTYEEPSENISGLLIVNSEMNTAPDERCVDVEPNVEKYMKQRGDYKILSSVDLYNLVEADMREGIETEAVEGILNQDNTLLEFTAQQNSS